MVFLLTISRPRETKKISSYWWVFEKNNGTFSFEYQEVLAKICVNINILFLCSAVVDVLFWLSKHSEDGDYMINSDTNEKDGSLGPW